MDGIRTTAAGAGAGDGGDAAAGGSGGVMVGVEMGGVGWAWGRVGLRGGAGGNW